LLVIELGAGAGVGEGAGAGAGAGVVVFCCGAAAGAPPPPPPHELITKINKLKNNIFFLHISLNSNLLRSGVKIIVLIKIIFF
jgi:hypothetical protein